MKKNKIIALDCDGVLLNYNEAYGRALEEFLGEKPTIVSPTAYFCHNYFDVQLNPQQKTEFYKFFNDKGWGMMTDLPRSIEATHKLREAGYKIIVVTSMPKIAQDMRHKNLLDLGFAVDATIATGKKNNNINPKKSYIEALLPEYFVDDLMENFHNIDSSTHFVLVDSQSHDSPNLNFEHKIKLHSTHNTLWDFVEKHII